MRRSKEGSLIPNWLLATAGSGSSAPKPRKGSRSGSSKECLQGAADGAAAGPLPISPPRALLYKSATVSKSCSSMPAEVDGAVGPNKTTLISSTLRRALL